MNEAVVHFTLSTCPLITIFPFVLLTQAYNNLSEEEKENTKVSLTSLLIGLPILFGILHAILYLGMGFVPRKTSEGIYLRFIVSGSITALIISLIMHYIFNIYNEWFEIENINMMHIFVFIFYLIYFYTIGQWIRYQVLYGPPLKKKSSSSRSSKSSPSSRSRRDTLSFDELKQKMSK